MVLNKKELKVLCDSNDPQEQIEQLMEWGIPFRLTKITGSIKVLRADLHFTANNRSATSPNYEAINTQKK